jgi:hypothetical protein
MNRADRRSSLPVLGLEPGNDRLYGRFAGAIESKGGFRQLGKRIHVVPLSPFLC